MLVAPMARNGIEPLGAMGNDSPLAVLSNKPKLLYSYFKQLFAQVTNPPIDAIREEMVISTEVFVGAESNLLKPTPQSCHQIRLDYPFLTNKSLAKIRHNRIPGFAITTLPILFEAGTGGAGLALALDELFQAADAAIARGVQSHHPVRPRRGQGTCADPGAAGGFRSAPSPHRPGNPDPGRPDP